MPSLLSCRPRVDMQQSQCLVVFHLEYMRMAGDKQFGWRRIYASHNRAVVIAGISPDMLHQHIHLLAFESEHLWKHASEVSTVAVAAHSPQRAECRQSVGQFRTAYIPCVPNLVARFEILQVFIVPIGVGIANYSYFL